MLNNTTAEVGAKILLTLPDAFALAISALAFFVSIAALYFSWRRVSISKKTLDHQMKIAHKSAQIQTLTQFRTSSKDFSYSDGIELIAKLQFKDFQEYQTDVSDDDRRKIRSCVEHLNFVANLVEAQIVEQQTSWNLYFMSYRILADSLEPWWFDGMSAMHPKRFSSARFQAQLVTKITPEQIETFDKDRRNRLEQKSKLI